jgi:type VI secretion system protein ImpG
MAPTPAMLVAECAPKRDDTALASGPVLPRGSALRLRRALGQNTHCEFRTAQDVRIWPIELTQARCFSHAPTCRWRAIPARARCEGLRLTLRTQGGLPFNQMALDELVLFLGGLAMTWPGRCWNARWPIRSGC